MTRRACLAAGLAAALPAAPPKRYKVALIGHTGRGNYGHNWDLAWNAIPAAEVVAVADPDPKGRAVAAARCHAQRQYAGYTEMLRREKPDIVTIGVRWADQHLAIVRACAEAGAHMILEKPMAQSLPEADAMVEIAARHRVKIQVGHAARASATGRKIREMLRDGTIGTLLEMRARGKEDRRAGGEDLVVLGSHALDLMRWFAGDPAWVFAHVTEGNREITPSDAKQGRELVGAFAGDQVAAMFLFPNGVHGYFGSKAAEPVPPGERCGVSLYGSKGIIFINLGNSRSAEAFLLRAPLWRESGEAKWERLGPGRPEIEPAVDHASEAMALDLIDAIEHDREPVCGARDGRWTIEMIAGIYQSQFSGSRIAFPLRDRRDPFAA